jgi:hypothetical protein
MGSLTRVAQSRRWLYLPDGWDTGWVAARAAVGTAPAYVAVVGDSNSQGFSTTDHMAKPFPVLLRNALVAKYGSYADYYPASLSARFQTVIGGSAPAGTMPWTFDTTVQTTGGPFYSGLVATMFVDGGSFPLAWVNAGTGKFVTPYACTDLDIIFHDGFAGTWKYNIDDAVGGGLVTVTNDARNSMRRASVTGQTSAVHTIRVGNPSVIYAFAMNGVVTYATTAAQTSGVGFSLLACTGMRVFDWSCSVNNLPPDRTQQLQGRYKSAVATELVTGFGFPVQPHLAIVELGINDCANSNGPVQFARGLRRICDSIRYGRDNASIIFLICPNPAIATSDSLSEFTHAESWSVYLDQIYFIAAAYQCAVFNVHADWMSTPVAQGWTAATDAHPTDAGHQAIADVLATLVV